MKFTKFEKFQKMIIYYLKESYSRFRNKSLKNILGIVIPILFFVFMSYYSILLYNAYNFGLLDLGVSYRLEYLFISTHSLVNWPIPHANVSAKPYTKLIYVPLSLTLLIYNSPVTLLVTQVGFIALGGYAIYRIFRKITNSTSLAILMQLVYFMYVPTYGYLAHGGNFMVYFEPLFLVSYMYYIEKKFTRSFIFIAFASIANSFAPIILILFYLIQIIIDKQILNKFLSKKERAESIFSYILKGLTSRTKEKYFFIAIFLFGAIIFIMQGLIYTFPGLITAARVNISSSNISSSPSGLISIFGSMIDLKFQFLSQILFPFLAIPLITPFAIIIVPYLIISWYANAQSYYDPLQQYPYLFAGILFVSVAYFFKSIKNKKMIKKIVTIIFIFTLVEFLVFSPFNLEGLENGSFSSILHKNDIEKELDYGFSLIPINSTVFIYNFPQLMDCKKIYTPYNYNNESVDYAVIDPIPFNKFTSAFLGFNSYWSNMFAHNSTYGIYESIQGIVIYKHYYDGTPVYYVPQVLINPINKTYVYNQTLPYSQYSAGSGWWTLSPGVYNFSFAIKANSSKDLPSQVYIVNNVYYSSIPTQYFVYISSSQFKYYGGLYHINCTYYSQGFYTVNVAIFNPSGYAQGNFTFEYFMAQQVSLKPSNNIESELISGISLIPKNATVLVQKDFPFMNNWKNVYFSLGNNKIDYVIVGALNPMVYSISSSFFVNYNSSLGNLFAHNSTYGIYESIQGIVIYKHYYNGTPVYYVPQVLINPINKTYVYNQTLPYSQYSAGSGWWTLSPGVYNFSFAIKANSSKDLPSQVYIVNNVYYSSIPTQYFVYISSSQFKYYGGLYHINCTYYSQGFYTVNVAIFNPSGYAQGNFTFEYFMAQQVSLKP